MYKFKGFQYSPDIVIFNFGINDRIKRFPLSDKEFMKDNLPYFLKAGNYQLWLKSDFYRFLRKLISKFTSKNVAPSTGNAPRVSLKEYEENILQMSGLTRKNGATLIVLPPFLCKDNAYKRKMYARFRQIGAYRKELERVISRNNIRYIDIEILTDKSEYSNTQFFEDWIHPNESGHRLIMQRVYEYIIDNQLINISAPSWFSHDIGARFN
jgi:lysophospholipase L1-like esterase